MRVIAGKFGGRILVSPSSQKIRPTTDRVRESLFQIIESRYPLYLDNTNVIDLFAGTGALGLESLSRGAKFCLFIDNSAEGRGLIRQNVENLSLGGATRIFKRDAENLGPINRMETFDLAFLDPPYEQGLGEKALHALIQGEWLNKQALVIWEEAKCAEIMLPDQFELVDERLFGDTKMRFLLLRS